MAEKKNAANKAHYGQKEYVLAPGSKVLVWNLGVPGKHKLAGKWKYIPYEVVKTFEGQPVYRVKSQMGPRDVWVLYRNYLLFLGSAVPSSLPPRMRNSLKLVTGRATVCPRDNPMSARRLKGKLKSAGLKPLKTI